MKIMHSNERLKKEDHCTSLKQIKTQKKFKLEWDSNHKLN